MTNRDDLLNELKLELLDANKDKKIREQVFAELKDRNFEDGYDMFSGSVAIDAANDIQLGLIAKLVYEATHNEKINPSKYFFDNEISAIESLRFEKNEAYPIVFEDVIRINDNVYSTRITPQMVWDLQNSHVIKYNKEAQRSTKFIEYGNRIIEKLDVDNNEVKEISEKMLSGTYKPDDMSFNISKEHDSDFIYDQSSHTLTIYSGRLEVNDGFHRLRAMINVYKEDPGSTFAEGLKITHYSLSDAKDVIDQFNKQRKLQLEHVRTLSDENPALQIVKMINENAESEFRNKIVKSEVLISKRIGYTYYSIMMDAIEKLFKDETKTKVYAKRTGEYIIDILNNIYAELYDYFERDRSDSIVTHKNIFVVYLAIAKALHGEDKREDVLAKLLKEIDFRKDGELDNFVNVSRATKISFSMINKAQKYINDKLNRIREM